VFVHGIRCWNSALTDRIEVLNFGFAGSEAVNNWGFGTNPWSPRQTISFYQLDLIIIMLGLNDVDNGITTSAQFRDSLQAIIDAWRGQTDIVLCTFTPADVTWEPIIRQDEWIAVIREVAQANNIPLIDHYADRGSFAANPSQYSDNVHGTQTGYTDIMDRVDRFLKIAA
jgi:lysophospholipase L1-like esterase